MGDQEKWDRRFLMDAAHHSVWSKDPSTKVGALIVDNLRRIISTGYNGPAKGVIDSDDRFFDRELKLALTLHAEQNAILFAKTDLTDCTIYVYPMEPCSICASMIIQTGIKRVVTIEPTPEQEERWGSNFEISRQIFKETGVELVYIK